MRRFALARASSCWASCGRTRTPGRRPAWFPNDVFGALAARGWLGLKYEGARDLVADAVLAEELPRCGSGGVAAGIGAHTHIATPPIFRFGTAEQSARWLAPAIRGEQIGALAITEPDAGSDVASMRTRADAVDGGWLVSGAKTYITNGVRADFYVTAVRTGGPGHAGLSVPRARARRGRLGARAEQARLARLRHRRDRLRRGLRARARTCSASRARGFNLIMANFQWERLVMALGAVGAMRRTLERAAAELGGRGQATIATASPSSPPAPPPAPRSPTTRCAATWPATTPCARSRWPSSPPSARTSTSRTSACA